jgi:MFS family permease
MAFYVIVGKWSDRVGRKLPLMLGGLLTLALLFPMFWVIGGLANPGLAASARAAPVVVSGSACQTDPFADLAGRKQSDCGKVLETLTASGVPYRVVSADTLGLTAGGATVPIGSGWLADGPVRKKGIEAALTAHGFDFSDQYPGVPTLLGIGLALVVLGALSALTYGPVAALLAEMFPAPIRYSSMSIPYHIGAGYLGGFLPLIASYINARTGNAYAGLWYTWVVVAVGVVVGTWGLKGGPPRDYADG